MLFSLDVRRALEGDCFILHYGPNDDPRLALIDGGPKTIYRDELKPRLEVIRRERGLDKNDPLPVELLMVSHVDEDHIQGILDLTKDLQQDDKRFARLLNFWHNGFENVIGQVPEQLMAAFGAAAVTASLEEEPSELARDLDTERWDAVASLKILSSVKQGAQLVKDIKALGGEANLDFDGDLIVADENTQPLDMGDGLTLTVVGPMLPELKKLHAEHQRWLKRLAKDGEKPEDKLAAYVDDSPSNLSSIVVLAEVEDRSILFTGDALGNKVLEGLELIGRVEGGGKLHVSVLKVPHHGSANNLETDFFERITADHYVFTGDGQYGNPERESFEMLLAARGDKGYTIHLAYPLDHIDAEREKDWAKKQAQDVRFNRPVREDWSHEQQSLQALFAEHKTFARRLSFVEKGRPYVIDLLDELGF